MCTNLQPKKVKMASKVAIGDLGRGRSDLKLK
jgi:hypothetical protein